jgi:hypothetical protein
MVSTPEIVGSSSGYEVVRLNTEPQITEICVKRNGSMSP